MKKMEYQFTFTPYHYLTNEIRNNKNYNSLAYAKMTKPQKLLFEKLFNWCWKANHRLVRRKKSRFIHLGFLANRICEEMGVDLIFKEDTFINSYMKQFFEQTRQQIAWIQIAKEVFQKHDLILHESAVILPMWIFE